MAGRFGYRLDLMSRLKRKTKYEGNCWIWTGKLVNGYAYVWHEGDTIRLARLICQIYHKDKLIPNWVARHKDECISRACWNPEHLEPGLQIENVRDQIRTGRFHYGTANMRNIRNKNANS
jgi:hypothetical protein